MIDIIFFLKPLFDMLWQFKIFDMVLLSLLIGYLLINFAEIKIGFTTIILSLVAFLFFRSLLIDTSQFTVFMKIISAFLIFLVAFFNKNPQKTIKVIAFSFLMPVVYSLILAITGKGYIVWGNISTFVGPYYYKTDLAIMVVLSGIFFRYFFLLSQKKILRHLSGFYIFILAPWLIYISNSRMLMIVYLFLFIAIAMESLKYRKLKFSLGIKFLLFITLITLSVVGFNIYNTHSQLGISLFSSDVFSAANTQGRNGIWESTLHNFFSSSQVNILFGHYINADYNLNTYLNNDAHNTYLKVLVSTGVTGLVLYLLFCARILWLGIKFCKLSRSDNTKHFLANTLLFVFVFYMLCGFTQSNILFTQSTWYTFYLAGFLFNPVATFQREKKNNIDKVKANQQLERV